MASKMAVRHVFNSKEACFEFILPFNCTEMVISFGKLINLHTTIAQMYSRFKVYLQFVIVSNIVVILKELQGRQNPVSWNSK